jgi:hypothetical protein
MIQPLPFLLTSREHYYYRSMGEGQSGDSYSEGQDPRSQVSLCSCNPSPTPFLFLIFLVGIPQNLGARRNIESMLGTNPLLWCCPNVGPFGTGLKYQLAEKDGKWVEVSARDPPRLHERAYAYV